MVCNERSQHIDCVIREFKHPLHNESKGGNGPYKGNEQRRPEALNEIEPGHGAEVKDIPLGDCNLAQFPHGLSSSTVCDEDQKKEPRKAQEAEYKHRAGKAIIAFGNGDMDNPYNWPAVSEIVA